MTDDTFGAFDLLKIISSHPGLKYSRDNRWSYLGPDQRALLRRGDRPRPDHFGLWLDQRARRLPGRSVRGRSRNIPA